MARNIFYPSNDSYVLSATGEPQAGIQVKVYSRQSGGTQVTDLTYVGFDGSIGSAVPSGVLTSDGNGLIPAFAGPDGGATTLWGNHGMQGERIALFAASTGGGGGGGSVTFGTTSGTATEGNDSRVVGAAQKSANLSDLASASTARTNLGLGAAATLSTTQIAADAALTGTYGPGSDTWLKSNAAAFSFAFTGTPTYDTATGLPTSATVKWPDAVTGSFAGTIDGASNGYSGFTVTWAGSTTKTVAVTGITYDSNGLALGPTGLAVS